MYKCTPYRANGMNISKNEKTTTFAHIRTSENTYTKAYFTLISAYEKCALQVNDEYVFQNYCEKI